MKNLSFTIILSFLSLQLSFAQLGIGTTSPDPNAVLDIESTTQGVLIPRMLKAQRELIGGGSPAAGMLVYQTDDVAGFYFYNGTAWVSLTTVKPSGLESVDEGNGSGLVKVGRNPANYGNVGENAVDLSYSLGPNTNGATGFRATAMGYNTTSSGDYATALGRNAVASGNSSLATGRATLASGNYSTAMGGFTEASGSYSTAMGSSNIASGTYSTAMGFQTEASGSFSTAMGRTTTASGWYSTALGLFTQAESFATTAIGQYNIGGGTPTLNIPTDPLFEIGNGTSEINRSNALTVLKNGNVGIGATNPSDKLVIEGGRLEVLADIDASSSQGTGSIEVANSLRIDGNEIITNFSSTLYLQQGNNGNLVVDGNTIFVDALNDRVGIGTSSPSKTLDVRGQIIAVSDNSPALIVTGSSNTTAGDNGIISSNPSYPGSDLFLRSNDEVVVQIDFDNNESGNFQVENSSGTNLFIVNESGDATLSGTLTENSDRRLKKNIETIPYGLTEILQLQPKAYNWKAKDQEHKSLGLIAQEVQEVIENVVRIADDEDKTLSLSYTSLVPVLIKATQEQQAIIDEQADKIKALEKQNLTLKELEARLEKIEAKTFQ